MRPIVVIGDLTEKELNEYRSLGKIEIIVSHERDRRLAEKTGAKFFEISGIQQAYRDYHWYSQESSAASCDAPNYSYYFRDYDKHADGITKFQALRKDIPEESIIIIHQPDEEVTAGHLCWELGKGGFLCRAKKISVSLESLRDRIAILITKEIQITYSYSGYGYGKYPKGVLITTGKFKCESKYEKRDLREFYIFSTQNTGEATLVLTMEKNEERLVQKLFDLENCLLKQQLDEDPLNALRFFGRQALLHQGVLDFSEAVSSEQLLKTLKESVKPDIAYYTEKLGLLTKVFQREIVNFPPKVTLEFCRENLEEFLERAKPFSPDDLESCLRIFGFENVAKREDLDNLIQKTRVLEEWSEKISSSIRHKVSILDSLEEKLQFCETLEGFILRAKHFKDEDLQKCYRWFEDLIFEREDLSDLIKWPRAIESSFNLQRQMEKLNAQERLEFWEKTLESLRWADSETILGLVGQLEKRDGHSQVIGMVLDVFCPFLRNSIILFSAKKEELLSYITLGAKLYPGDEERHCFASTTNPWELAKEIKSRITKEGELQISVGFDTGDGTHKHRAKFIALAMFIISQNLKKFQALKEAPERDFGAAYGIIIRGINVDYLNPCNQERHRIDYIFQILPDLNEKNLGYLIAFLSYLNLGLLLTVTFPGYHQHSRDQGFVVPSLLPFHLAIIKTYEEFERDFVRILRKYTYLANLESIYQVPDQKELNQKRKEALQSYLLEECLWPDKEWLVDLDKPDDSWNKLLPYLRVIEAVVLQRMAREDETPPGDRFIEDIHQLVFQKATDIQFILEDKINSSHFPSSFSKAIDPFIDWVNFPDFTLKYLSNIKRKEEDQ